MQNNDNIAKPGYVKFIWSVASEANFDFLVVCIDKTTCDVQNSDLRISGTVNWTAVTLPVGQGSHTVRWAYIKDTATGVTDNADVDDIVFYSNSGNLAIKDSLTIGSTLAIGLLDVSNSSGANLHLGVNGNLGLGTTKATLRLEIADGSAKMNSLFLAGNNQLSSYNSFNNSFINSKFGLGTNNLQRITSNGNLTNIGSIDAGQLSLSIGGTFASPLVYTVGSTSIGSATGDLNGDGYKDIVVTNRNSANVSVLMNNRNGTFAAAVNYTAGTSPRSVAITDLNGDGKGDLIVTNRTSYTMSVLMNNGDGTFGTKTDYSINDNPIEMTINDFNGDGHMDVAIVVDTSELLYVFINSGNGIFNPYRAYSVGTGTGDIASGDLNGDNKPDLVFSNSTYARMVILMNKGDGTFNPRIEQSMSAAVNSINIGDFNGDGKNDAVGGISGGIYLWLNNGTGTLSYIGSTIPSITYNYDIATEDINSDGKIDLVSANYTSNTISVFLNTGVSPFFGSRTAYSTTGNAYSLNVNDLNNDGKKDLIVPNFNGSQVNVLFNNPTSVINTNAAGNVGFGTTAPGTYKVNIVGTGYLSAASWTYGSDIRLKENIQYYSDTGLNALDLINQLKPASFDYINGSKNEDGFIAQEVQAVLPKLVTTDEKGMLGLKTTNLIPYMVKATQELNSKLNLTSTGEINVDMNISPEVLSSLGYNGTKNEIENATYSLTDNTGKVVNSITQFGQIAAAKIKTGFLSATNIVTKNLVTEKLVTPKATIEELTSNNIEVTDTLKTENLVAKDATVSTLYADNIISKEGSIGSIMTEKVTALREEIKKLISNNNEATSSSTTLTGTSIMSQSSNWSMDIASDSAKISGDLSLTNNLIVGSKLMVNGDTQLGNAFITGTFTAGEIAIKDNFIETTNTAFYIQPSNTGSVHIMGDTLVIAENGEVQINGNLKITGSLMANLITADEIQTKKLTSINIGSSTIATNEIKIATDSAQSTIIAESGFGALATSSAQLSSNATAGTATLPAGKTEIIIHNEKINTNSMVYLTPVGSTKNQVPYIKTKFISPTPTQVGVTQSDSYFTIALDDSLTQDVEINWWIIN